MNHLVFITDKSAAVPSYSELHKFDRVAGVLTEKYGFKVRYDRENIRVFFDHADFKNHTLSYRKGELCAQNPSEPFINLMIRIAKEFDSAKVLGEDGTCYASPQERLAEDLSDEELEALVKAEAWKDIWSFMKVGMAVSAGFFTLTLIQKFVFV